MGIHEALPQRNKNSIRSGSAVRGIRVPAKRSPEGFPLECPGCGGDIRLIAFITEPGPSRKILPHLCEPLEPPSVSPGRGPPADWGELVQARDDWALFQASPDELPVIDIHSL